MSPLIPALRDPRGPLRDELVDVASRVRLLQVARLAMVASVLLAVQVDGRIVAQVQLVTVVALAYVGIGLGVELIGRSRPEFYRLALSWTLLLDGLWIAFNMAQTGGTEGPLDYLVYFHVVAVTLLISYRSGLKVAAWHAILVLVVATIELDAGSTTTSLSGPRVALNSVVFLLVAAGTALCSRVSEGALRRRRVELEAVVELSKGLQKSSRAHEVHAELVEHVTSRLGFERAVVLAGGTDGTIGAVSIGGSAVLVDWPGATMVFDLETLPGTTASLMRDLDAERFALLDQLMPWATNVVLVPVECPRLPPALLAAEWGGQAGDRLTRDVLQAVEMAARHAGLSLNSTALLDEVEWTATRDPLTGLVNRRFFDEALVRAVHGSQRSDEPLSLIVLDLDNFKAVNDTYGHQAGDEVLRAVGRAMARSSRNADITTRYGGEEFAVLLPACPGDQAVLIADRLRADIAAESTRVAITVSAGVATIPDDALSGHRLLAAADAALYQSKHDGRDRATRFHRPTLNVDIAQRVGL